MKEDQAVIPAVDKVALRKDGDKIETLSSNTNITVFFFVCFVFDNFRPLTLEVPGPRESEAGPILNLTPQGLAVTLCCC